MHNIIETIQAEKNAAAFKETTDMNVGGQAVIEGVMMRSPKAIATAVRLPDGTIELKKKLFVSFVTRYKFLNIPVLRGSINFIEMLFIGIETLNWSADVQMRFEDNKAGKKDSRGKRIRDALLMSFTFFLAFVFALLLFFMLPIYVATLFGLTKGALLSILLPVSYV